PGEPEAVNHSVCPPAQVAGPCVRGSLVSLLGWEPGEQVSDQTLGDLEVVFGAAQHGAKMNQICVQGPVITVVGVLAHIGAACWPNFHQALGGEHPDRGLCCVQRYAVRIAELAIRRHPAAWRADPADDPCAKAVGELSASET